MTLAPGPGKLCLGFISPSPSIVGCRDSEIRRIDIAGCTMIIFCVAEWLSCVLIVLLRKEAILKDLRLISRRLQQHHSCSAVTKSTKSTRYCGMQITGVSDAFQPLEGTTFAGQVSALFGSRRSFVDAGVYVDATEKMIEYRRR
jgi:hypothetical protein